MPILCYDIDMTEANRLLERVITIQPYFVIIRYKDCSFQENFEDINDASLVFENYCKEFPDCEIEFGVTQC